MFDRFETAETKKRPRNHRDGCRGRHYLTAVAVDAFKKNRSRSEVELCSIAPDEWLTVHDSVSVTTGINNEIVTDSRPGGAC